MLQRLLTLTLRTLRNRLGYTLIWGLGLTVGLACCAPVTVFLQYELTYNAHHDDVDRICPIIGSESNGDQYYSTIIFREDRERSSAGRSGPGAAVGVKVPRLSSYMFSSRYYRKTLRLASTLVATHAQGLFPESRAQDAPAENRYQTTNRLGTLQHFCTRFK